MQCSLSKVCLEYENAFAAFLIRFSLLFMQSENLNFLGIYYVFIRHSIRIDLIFIECA